MSALADALGSLGASVVYCADQVIPVERRDLGWEEPDFHNSELVQIGSVGHAREVCEDSPVGAVHLCQGIRGNGYVSDVQRFLRMSGRQYWVMMEAVDSRGLRGFFKDPVYRYLLRTQQGSLDGILAIGRDTPRWVSARNPSLNVIPFAYFPERYALDSDVDVNWLSPDRVNILFVGQIIPRKNLVSLIDEVAIAQGRLHLTVVGGGALEAKLKAYGECKLRGRFTWLGQRKQSEIPSIMAACDALILPSLHDGWGAVVSEAISVGTPAFCSDKCGAASLCEVAPGCGIFSCVNPISLQQSLTEIERRGKWTIDQRAQLIEWSRCVSPVAGARYLLEILGAKRARSRPEPPWRQ